MVIQAVDQVTRGTKGGPVVVGGLESPVLSTPPVFNELRGFLGIAGVSNREADSMLSSMNMDRIRDAIRNAEEMTLVRRVQRAILGLIPTKLNFAIFDVYPGKVETGDDDPYFRPNTNSKMLCPLLSESSEVAASLVAAGANKNDVDYLLGSLAMCDHALIFSGRQFGNQYVKTGYDFQQIKDNAKMIISVAHDMRMSLKEFGEFLLRLKHMIGIEFTGDLFENLERMRYLLTLSKFSVSELNQIRETINQHDRQVEIPLLLDSYNDKDFGTLIELAGLSEDKIQSESLRNVLMVRRIFRMGRTSLRQLAATNELMLMRGREGTQGLRSKLSLQLSAALASDYPDVFYRGLRVKTESFNWQGIKGVDAEVLSSLLAMGFRVSQEWASKLSSVDQEARFTDDVLFGLRRYSNDITSPGFRQFVLLLYQLDVPSLPLETAVYICKAFQNIKQYSGGKDKTSRELKKIELEVIKWISEFDQKSFPSLERWAEELLGHRLHGLQVLALYVGRERGDLEFEQGQRLGMVVERCLRERVYLVGRR